MVRVRAKYRQRPVKVTFDSIAQLRFCAPWEGLYEFAIRASGKHGFVRGALYRNLWPSMQLAYREATGRILS